MGILFIRWFLVLSICSSKLNHPFWENRGSITWARGGWGLYTSINCVRMVLWSLLDLRRKHHQLQMVYLMDTGFVRLSFSYKEGHPVINVSNCSHFISIFSHFLIKKKISLQVSRLPLVVKDQYIQRSRVKKWESDS